MGMAIVSFPSGLFMMGMSGTLLILLLLLHSSLSKNIPETGLGILLFLGFAIGVQGMLLHSYIFLGDDYAGHRQYFQLLYKHLWLPKPKEGWEAYQPPLYYLLAIPFYAIGSLSGAIDPVEMTRFFSLCCYIFFLFYGLATLNLLVRWKPALYVMAIVFITWPNGTVIAGKINNDVLIYPLFVASIYYFLLWQTKGEKPDLLRCMVLAIVSVAVKSIGILLCVSVMTVIIVRIVMRQIEWNTIVPSRSATILVTLLLLVCVGSNFGRTYYYRIIDKSAQNYLVGNQHDNSRPKHSRYWLEDDRINNYIIFNPKTFVSNPFFEPEGQHSDRYLFWNSLFKSLVFRKGYLPGDYWKVKQVACAIMTIYLGMLAYTFISMIGLIYKEKDARWHFFPILLVTALSVAGLIYLRINYPLGGLANARYIYFVLPWFLAFMGGTIAWHYESGRKKTAWTGMAGAISLVISFLIFLTLQWF